MVAAVEATDLYCLESTCKSGRPGSGRVESYWEGQAMGLRLSHGVKAVKRVAMKALLTGQEGNASIFFPGISSMIFEDKDFASTVF